MPRRWWFCHRLFSIFWHWNILWPDEQFFWWLRNAFVVPKVNHCDLVFAFLQTKSPVYTIDSIYITYIFIYNIMSMYLWCVNIDTNWRIDIHPCMTIFMLEGWKTAQAVTPHFNMFLGFHVSCHSGNGLPRYILYHMSKPNVTRVQSATEWTASVHTLTHVQT